jgi:hypothetical protein
VSSNGEVRQGERRPVIRRFDEGSHTSPACEECLQAEVWWQDLKTCVLARGEKPFGKRSDVDVSACVFDVGVEPAIRSHRDQREVCGVGNIKPQPPWILLYSHLPLTARMILEAYFVGGHSQLPAQKES